MQSLNIDQWATVIGTLLLALLFIFGEGTIVNLFKPKPEIRIKKVWLTPIAQGSRHLYIDLRNEGKASASNFNIEIRILDQMKDFEANRFDELLQSRFFPSRTTVQPMLGWLVPSENAYFVNTTIQNYHLALGHVHKIQVRFTYEGVVEKPRYEIILNARSPEHTVHFKELS